MNTHLRVALIGAKGRMGQAIQAVAENENVEIVALVDSGQQILTNDADAWLDFSSPAAAEAICAAAAQSATPLIIGTTGHSAVEREFIEMAARAVPIVFSSNFSVGVNLLFSLAETAARVLGEGFDAEIIEAHHAQKKDAPSGTARTLAEILQRERHAEQLRYGRAGMVGERDPAEIGIHSVRGGDIVGDHTVLLAGSGERLELTHRAGSRETFARGALRAAHWVVGNSPGLYSMRDVLVL